jgi:hypothetical protein
MTTKLIKDSNNKVIGAIKSENGIDRIVDKNNQTLGTYNNRTNSTYDRNNKRLGSEDTLTRLLK